MLSAYRRAERFLGQITSETRILEIGALNRPTMKGSPYRAEYADFATTTRLKELYAKNASVDVTDIVHVDYVVNDNDYARAIGEPKFDLILASHVAEHVPDFITWLQSLYHVLAEGGVLSLIVPDKRFTFDLLRTETTAADLLSCYQARLTKPSTQQIFDHVRHHVPLQGLDLWNPPTEETQLKTAHSENQAWELTLQAMQSDEYMDAHCSILTPHSLFSNLKRIEQAGLISFVLDGFYDTTPGEIDFQLRLRKTENRSRTAIRDLNFTFTEELPYSLNTESLSVVAKPSLKSSP